MSFKILLLCPLLCLNIALANDAAKINQELEQVRKTINEEQVGLQNKQDILQNTRATLEKTRTALAKIQQELVTINEHQHEAQSKIETLQNKLNNLKAKVSATKAQIARLLVSQHQSQSSNAMILFFQNAEHGKKMRHLQYSRYINEANQKAIDNLSYLQRHLKQQETTINTELARLKEIQTQQQTTITTLNKTHSNAVSKSTQLIEQIESHKQRINKLHENEKNLNALLADIIKRNIEKQRQEAQAHLHVNGEKNTSNSKNQHLTLTAGEQSLKAPSQNAAHQNGFSRMQGRLKSPVNGKISGHFGQPRASGGVWRGVFFDTPTTAVRSIASGMVAYSGPLEGYGNIVAIDHGDGYFSVYSGLSSTKVRDKTKINTGHIIGTSGKLPQGEQGLYLQIRYRHQPMNPLSWIR